MESAKRIALVGEETVLTSMGQQSAPFYEGQYRAENGNLCKFGPTYWYSTTFPQKECYYQKEATGMESPKMYCSIPWKNPTCLCWSANYPVSWGGVQGQEWKYAKLWAYQSPWYRISTKEMFIAKVSYRYGELKNVFQ